MNLEEHFEEHTHLGSWSWDPTRDIVNWSPTLCKLFGIDPSQPAPNWAAHSALYTAESFLLLEKTVNLCLTKGIPYEVQLEAIHANGTHLHVEAHGRAEYNEKGEVVQLSGLVIDRTRELTSEKMFRAIANYTVAWESWFGMDGKYRWVSPSVEKITGYSPKEIIAMPDFITSLVAPQDRELAAATLYGAIAGVNGGKGDDLELRCLRKDGSMYWLSISWQKIYDEKGVPLGIRTSGRDVTERKLLQEQQRLSDIALNSISQGVILTDLGQLIISANDAFCAITGYSREEVLGRNCKFLQGPETDPATVDKIRSAIQGRVEFNGRILDYRKDGVAFWNSLSIVPIRDENGVATGFVGVTRDVTEAHHREIALKETTTRALAADKMKTEFLGMMSHEFRTPLNGILGFSDILLTNRNLTPEVRDLIKNIASSSRLLLRVLEDIIDYSELEGGNLDLRIIPFSLSDIAWRSIRLIQTEANAKALQLVVKIGDDVPGTVRGDPERIQQILNNLLRNALKHTKHGGIVLTIELLSSDNDLMAVRFSVRDTGTGIPQEQRDKIFLPFVQLDSTLSRKFEGIGIGLALSKQLVEKMGSQLNLESQVGEGSCFSFDLIFKKEPSGLQKCKSKGEESVLLDKSFASRFPLRILAVDDNVINLQVLTKMLENLGYRDVISANCGEDALDILDKQQIDLIFMDLHMPGIDGIETTRRIRLMESRKSTQSPVSIIALTANVSPLVRDQCFKVGMKHYIPKPFNIQSLAEGIMA